MGCTFVRCAPHNNSATGGWIRPCHCCDRLLQEQSGTLSKYFQHTIGALLQVCNGCPFLLHVAQPALASSLGVPRSAPEHCGSSWHGRIPAPSLFCRSCGRSLPPAVGGGACGAIGTNRLPRAPLYPPAHCIACAASPLPAVCGPWRPRRVEPAARRVPRVHRLVGKHMRRLRLFAFRFTRATLRTASRGSTRGSMRTQPRQHAHAA